jgi:hypothetical protein
MCKSQMKNGTRTNETKLERINLDFAYGLFQTIKRPPDPL